MIVCASYFSPCIPATITDQVKLGQKNEPQEVTW